MAWSGPNTRTPRLNHQVPIIDKECDMKLLIRLAAGNPLFDIAGIGFADLNGDGINDNAPDDDHDGIPNGQDPVHLPPQDGTG
jgi:hypothetical protein